MYPAEENIAVFILKENGVYDGATIYAAGDQIKSAAVKGIEVYVDDVFTPRFFAE